MFLFSNSATTTPKQMLSVIDASMLIGLFSVLYGKGWKLDKLQRITCAIGWKCVTYNEFHGILQKWVTKNGLQYMFGMYGVSMVGKYIAR